VSIRTGSNDPLELELIESAYDVAWKAIVARDLNRDTSRDAERQGSLRRLIFVFARQGAIDFDTLCDKVLGVCLRLGCRLRPRNEAVRRREAFRRSEDSRNIFSISRHDYVDPREPKLHGEKGRPPKRAPLYRIITGSRLGRKRFRLCGILRGSFHHLPLEKGLKLERRTRLQFAVGIPMPSELSTMPAIKSW
jgi:hypothetical protein